MVVRIVVMLVLVTLDANLYDLFENGGVLPTDWSETGSRIKNRNGLDSLETNTYARYVTGRGNIELYEAADDLVVGHWGPLVLLG